MKDWGESLPVERNGVLHREPSWPQMPPALSKSLLSRIEVQMASAAAPLLTLRIANADSLLDGGPLYFVTQGQNFEMGRNKAMHWVLPDPSNHISGEHLRVVWHAGNYWLQDVSKNGTYLNGQTTRLTAPHLVEHNDQIRIGNYIIVATLSEAPANWEAPVKLASHQDWNEDTERTSVPRPPLNAWTPDRPAQDRPVVSAPIPSPFAAAAPAPAAPVAAAAGGDVGARALLDAICRGAGLAQGSLMVKDPERLGEELGRCIRIAAEQSIALLAGRAKSKAALKSRNRTMMNALDNNPLKFAPDGTTALQALFVQRAAYYLPAAEAFAEGFDDIKRHETAVFSAMQKALSRLVEDLSPESIESRVPHRIFSSRKARAWEKFTERWDAKTHPHENGMLDVFLAYFSEAYDAISENPSTARR